MADQVCGLGTEQAAEDLLKAAKVCLLKLMPEGLLGTPLFLLLVLCLLAAPLVFQYFLGLVGQGSQPGDSLERQDYERLRASLAGDSRPANLYAHWLSKFLDWIERFCGDVGMADRTLFPHLFRLTKPAPLWTAPALDRCLLLAVIYPVVTIFIIWMLFGQVGPGETALGLRDDLPEWRRVLGVVAYAMSGLAMWRYTFATGWRSYVWGLMFFSAPFVGLGAFGFESGGALAIVSFFTYQIPFLFNIRLPSALTIHDIFRSEWTRTAFPGAFSAALVCFVPIGSLSVEAGLSILASAVLFAIAALAGAASTYKSLSFYLIFLSTMTAAYLAAATLAAFPIFWQSYGAFLLFLGLLTLLSAPFDWISLGLTRGLLRLGLQLEGWWPYFLALLDACLAAMIVALFELVMVVGVQTFDELAIHGGGKAVMDLDFLFDSLAKDPAAPRNWWIYALLLSSVLPSLVNLAIGGMALTRGIPWLGRLLLRWIPADRAVPTYKQRLAATGLTAQVFAGVLLGVAAEVFLFWGVIFRLMPTFGLDLLAMARAVAVYDLPGQLGTLFAGSA